MSLKKLIRIAIIVPLIISIQSYADDSSPTNQMSKAANAFLASLKDRKRERASHSFNSSERSSWMYIPASREGLALKHMSSKQQKLAFKLVEAGLSEMGYSKAKAIIKLEEILGIIENSPGYRDPELYYLTVFGNPQNKGRWAWRFAGHHLSMNFTIVDGELVSNTPYFWGANPAVVKMGEHKGMQVLKREEELARELLSSLTSQQKGKAIIAKDAYREILTRAEDKVEPLSDKGLAYSNMGNNSRKLLSQLIDVYISSLKPEFAKQRWQKIESEGLSNVKFAWAGSDKPGDRHYYRVQGKGFLIEYANYQNRANHVHAVWREFDGDFGRDILKEHFRLHQH